MSESLIAPCVALIWRERRETSMVSSKLTEGMSTVEIWVVMLAALASRKELLRLAAFFQEYAR